MLTEATGSVHTAGAGASQGELQAQPDGFVKDCAQVSAAAVLARTLLPSQEKMGVMSRKLLKHDDAYALTATPTGTRANTSLLSGGFGWISGAFDCAIGFISLAGCFMYDQINLGVLHGRPFLFRISVSC